MDQGSDPTPKFHRIWDGKYNYNAAKTDQGSDPNPIFIKLNMNFNEKFDQGRDPGAKFDRYGIEKEQRAIRVATPNLKNVKFDQGRDPDLKNIEKRLGQ